MSILVVGGAGYIGSHVCKALKKAGFEPIVYDSLENGHAWAIKWGPLIQGDLLDKKALDQAFKTHRIVAVIHLASYINVRESEENPDKYFKNNVRGTEVLLQVMADNKVDQIVFSSTAAVYGTPKKTPISEDHPLLPINVYGGTKKLAEEQLEKFHQTHQIRSVALRYFNAAGADEEGEIGEAHSPETHLIPLAILTALRKNSDFKVFGTDHATPDGWAIRDYIHVSDLADSHVKALQWLLKGGKIERINIGTGKGSSVKEVIEMVSKIVGPFPYTVVGRKPADPPALVADSSRAQEILGWKPVRDLEMIIASAVRWHSCEMYLSISRLHSPV